MYRTSKVSVYHSEPYWYGTATAGVDLRVGWSFYVTHATRYARLPHDADLMRAINSEERRAAAHTGTSINGAMLVPWTAQWQIPDL
jgi:alkanesulfonate monooxygenase SsuD/methylene tetrahydromethanopterin reductase-like flavin-dependent oxidoreductase (luciferase family)